MKKRAKDDKSSFESDEKWKNAIRETIEREESLTREIIKLLFPNEQDISVTMLFPTNTIKIILDTSQNQTWSEIDAVKLCAIPFYMNLEIFRVISSSNDNNKDLIERNPYRITQTFEKFFKSQKLNLKIVAEVLSPAKVNSTTSEDLPNPLSSRIINNLEFETVWIDFIMFLDDIVSAPFNGMIIFFLFSFF